MEETQISTCIPPFSYLLKIKNKPLLIPSPQDIDNDNRDKQVWSRHLEQTQLCSPHALFGFREGKHPLVFSRACVQSI